MKNELSDYIKKFCYKEGTFKLHSGQYSNYIFDILEIINHEKFISGFKNFIKNEEYLLGIEFGGALLAAISGKPFGILRKDGTIYGLNYYDKITIIDDVVTTENSLKWADEVLYKKYHHNLINKFICIVDRRIVSSLEVKSILKIEE